MRLLILLVTFGLVVAGPVSVEAAPKKKSAVLAKAKKTSKKVKANKYSTAQLSTDVSFDDSVVHGQYQSPDEALARVENEKGLKDLLGARKHFKDRLLQAAEQE